jgi:hypothetical protein
MRPESRASLRLSLLPFDMNQGPPWAVIVLESSQAGCPGHVMVNPLYQPKGALAVSKPMDFSSSSTLLSMAAACSGGARLGDR